MALLANAAAAGMMFGLSKIKMVVPTWFRPIHVFTALTNDGNRMAQRKLEQRFDDIVSIIGRQ